MTFPQILDTADAFAVQLTLPVAGGEDSYLQARGRAWRKAKGHTPGWAVQPLFTVLPRRDGLVSLHLQLMNLIVILDSESPNDCKSIATKEESCACFVVGRLMPHFLHRCKNSRVNR